MHLRRGIWAHLLVCLFKFNFLVFINIAELHHRHLFSGYVVCPFSVLSYSFHFSAYPRMVRCRTATSTWILVRRLMHI